MLLLSGSSRCLSLYLFSCCRTTASRPHSLIHFRRSSKDLHFSSLSFPSRSQQLQFHRNMASSADDIFATKQALRKEIRGKLKSLTRDEIQMQSMAVWDRLQKLPAYQQAHSVGLFLSMPRGEIDTDPALAHALSTGKTIYVPRVGQNFESADMELHKVILDNNADSNADADAVSIFHHKWPRNKWGIPEPPHDMPRVLAQPGDIDVLVVPGLAFDRKGNRLGQGKGYYDRFMERMFVDSGDNKKPPLLIAVGLSCQLVEGTNTIPVKDHDHPVDWILVPEAAIQTR